MGKAADAPAVLLRHRYEFLETLGVGDGRVVKALDHQHGRLVALKVRAIGTEGVRDDLLEGARVLFGLPPHPSLPVVREDFFEGDEYVIVMDWVEGIDLARLLGNKGTPGLPLSSVLAYLAEAAEALTFLHAQPTPVIHGDVKPANLILTRGGRVTLVHCGLSSALGGGGMQRGTTGFRAPELEAGGPPSRATDVFALAATAVTLLTGAPPRSDEPSRWGQLDPAQAGRLDGATAAGLATDPAARPATPGELVERLRSGWAATLPTGVMTFCMSDIEGSTRLWEQRPAAMAEALVRHDELLARVVETHGGRVLKSMGEGDSTVSVFQSAGRAVAAALEVNRALAGEPWPEGTVIKARFGLHTGEARRRGGDYYGATLNVAARVRGEAAGGEILLSATTAGLARADVPVGFEIIDMGPHQLRGIEHPVSVSALTGPGLATAPAGAICPYRGLLAFQPGDRHLFFGREEVVADLLARVAPGRVLAVVGASGSGKSSLLRAGLLAAVQAGDLPAVRTSRLLTPSAALELKPDEDAVDALLVVDQFEEVYTQCDAVRRAQFVGAVLAWRGPVVIGVRADFYSEISADAELAAAVAQNQVLLSPMQDADLRRTIAEPARLAGLRLEPGLVDLVLRDVAGEPGALPLMSHALRETWERRDGRRLTVAAYQESGGVISAIAQTADAVVAATPEADRLLLRSVFLRLTQLGDNVEDSRRRVSMAELLPQDGSDEGVRTLLERLTDARLVTLDEGTVEVAHEVLIRRWPTLRRWLEEDREGIRLHRRLGDAARLWDAAGREPGDLYRGTRLDAAVEWAKTNSALLNGTERDFLRAGVDESVAALRRQRLANRRLRRALASGALLLVAALALLVFALSSRQNAVRSGDAARSLALATESEGQLARDPQRALLLGRAALAAAPRPEARLATTEALDANTLRSQLPSLGIQGCADSNYLVLLDQGRRAAVDTCNGDVVLADLEHSRIVRRVHVGPTATGMVLSQPDTLTVATGRNLDTVDVRTGEVRHIFTAPFSIEQLAGGPPGRALAIADRETIGLVNLKAGRLRVISHGDASVNAVNGMMWASADVLLVASTGKTRGHGSLFTGLTALNVLTRSPERVRLVAPSDEASVVFLRVSPDLRTWYVTGAKGNAHHNDATAATWAVDARSHRVRWVERGPLGAYASPVQVSPDSRLVAVGYSNGAADVIAAPTGKVVIRDSSSSTVASGDLALAPGDNVLVTASLDGLLRTWSTHGTERLRLQAPGDTAVAFTGDGRGLVLLGDHGEVVEGSTGRVLRTFPGFSALKVFNRCNTCFTASPQLRWLTYLDPTSATPRIIEIEGQTGRRVAAVMVPRLDAQGVAPDGRIVATYDNGDRVVARVIDPRTGAIRNLPSGPSNLGCVATTPSFTPDGRSMAIIDGCVHLVVWDLHTGLIKRTIELPEPAIGAAVISPDGRYVLTTTAGGAFVRADLLTGRVAKVPGVPAEATVAKVSPNGRFYAVGRQDGTIEEYDSRSLRLVRRHTLQDPIQALAFSPDSSEMAVEDTNNAVRVWDTCAICENPTRLAELAAHQSVRELTADERATFGTP